MKCKFCGGTGTSNTCINGTFKPCTFCDGTGEYEPFDADVELDKLYPTEQTNEEWLRQATTEQLAKFLHDVQFSCNTCTLTSFRLYKSKTIKCPLQVSCAKENGVMEWLKQPHKE